MGRSNLCPGLRASEYKYLARNLHMVAASTFLMWTSPTIVAITTFGTCILLGVPLTPGRVLSTIATLRVLRMPLQNISDFAAIQAKVSLHRLLLFSQEPELPTDSVVKGNTFELHDYAIEVENGAFSWYSDVDEEKLPPTLRGMNLRVRKGAHVAVCGPVGSGKSALLACMLGEIPKLEGMVRVEGKTAYVAQTPWIQSGTFKENICIGRRMDEGLYERVLQACDLKDITMFPFGDETGIGERGINLSGGQKQRVQLARALYQEADVYFLDDPFSAVDAHTGSHLLKGCMMGMLASKTVVYVTHKMESLSIADHIGVLRDGIIIQAGKFKDLLQSGTDFSALICAHNKALENMKMNASMTKDVDLNNLQRIYPVQTPTSGGSYVKKTESATSNVQNNNATSPVHETVVALEETTPLQQLVKEEERERGQVRYRVCWAYATTVAGAAFVPVYLLSQVGFQAFQILSSYWMAWGTSPSDGGSAQVSTKILLFVYIFLAFLRPPVCCCGQ